MCGITAGATARNIAPILIEGLRRLEYRGYDSAGIAFIDENATIQRIRALGKVESLANAFGQDPKNGRVGIAHTRWATHGKPNETNAHPHMYQDKIALVHNGIIENYETLKSRMQSQGVQFQTDTDSEVIVQNIGFHLRQEKDFGVAVYKALQELKGTYSVAVICKDFPDTVIAARRGAPLILGVGIKENFVASDMLALLPITQDFVVLEEGDMVVLTKDEYLIIDGENQPVKRAVQRAQISEESVERGHYRHYMQKEIFEQPRAALQALEGRVGQDTISERIFGLGALETFSEVKALHIVACGTSYHAGLIAKHWIEEWVKIPCTVEIGSEMHFRNPIVLPGTLFVTLSQSGETADTLSALKGATSPNYCGTLAICNVPESSLVRESKHVLLTHAGPEVGVASTKAFTAQLIALLMLVICLGQRTSSISFEIRQQFIRALRALPGLIEEMLKLDNEIQKIATRFVHKHHALFLGRGIHFPVALEGALKLKEISYIHAEAYPAGELKHGPLALVDEDMPVIALVPNDKLVDKMKSNIQEVLARGGEVFAITQKGLLKESKDLTLLSVGEMPSILSPILFTIPLQLLAYHVAVLKGTDVDRPRNLAKSVTVE